ncbi:MAG: Tellurite resistance protein TerB [Alphaproteobacteria bacterium ADurb.Bin438]|nr:MAG: Tellurite resistance protein TerB [Alphaproteobacteria bacterium ADurb.Bin438]
MLIFKEIPANQKLSFLKILAIIGHINTMDDKKIGFIKDLYDSFEINICDFDEITKENEIELAYKECKNITSLKFKRVLIREMFFIAYSDGELIDEEIKFIVKVADLMGISEAITLTIGDWVVRYIELEGEGDALFSKDV